MIDIEHEPNPERLRNVARLQHAQIRHLTSLLARSRAELGKLTGAESNLALELATIAKLPPSSSPSSASKSIDHRKSKPATKPQTGHGPTAQPALPQVVIACKLDLPDQICPSCGASLSEMPGQCETSEIVDVVEVQYRVVQVQQQSYRCGCGACVDTALPSAEVPERNIAGGRYSFDFAVKVAIDKYLHHLPPERQVRMMAQHHLVVTSQALWDQLLALALCLDRAHMECGPERCSRAAGHRPGRLAGPTSKTAPPRNGRCGASSHLVAYFTIFATTNPRRRSSIWWAHSAAPR